MSLLPVEEAQRRLLAAVMPLPLEQASLTDALGRYLAEPVAALRDQPWAALSAMDGYAIRHAEMPGPWTLTGESRAGETPPSVPLPQGGAMRIFTGAPLPAGADCILIQEEAQAEGSRILLTGEGPGHVGRNVRERASDFGIGQTLLSAGVRIGPAQIALAAMAGHAALPVRRRPKVALLSTGDELVPVGESVGPGKIPASNGIMLASMLAAEGAEVIDTGIIPDNLDAVTAAFRGAADADIILSTGGASVGDHDLVAPAILRAGGALDFWKIAMRPGKPLMAGSIGAARIIGLPGNPVAAFATGILFVLPLVRALMGADQCLPRHITVTTNVPLPKGSVRAEYLRAIVEDGRITAIGNRDSAALLTLATSNALVELPIGSPPIPPGSTVRAIMV